jgi:hypothetical protein
MLVDNLLAQLGKLFLSLFVLGFILSVVTGSVGVGFGIVGGIAVAVLAGIAVWLVVLIRKRRSSETARRREPLAESGHTPLVHPEAIDATQKAIAVMTALLDGTEGGNWHAAQSAVADYTSDDTATAALVSGFINLGEVLVNEIKLLTGESTAGVLSKTSKVIGGLGQGG